jgi:hypothetical protein
MGANQRLARSIVPIRDQGGVSLSDRTRVAPRPLVGRNAAKLGQLARKLGIARWRTDLDAAPSNPDDTPNHATELGPPLHEALAGNRGVAETLLAAGARLDVRGAFAALPIHAAAWSGDVELVGLGVGPHAVDGVGWTALHPAVAADAVEATRFLLDGASD